ncbi:MAG: UDP-N-acetylglucosamine--N-acetylmuramyl-(pentapeptide) pyrophosphoryl-undecaprenol N-acetylglucosamine transferase [Bacteroidetes bacterium]|nr:UDP-N-acetylglucosamine--N-acetylmuramyl-(pentapeptide) pyrophosphoryl-undecaprenol N-acetylglucosamine transferase [Bacteroidota bacterium]
MVRIVFTGGGTGGHLFPLIAVTRELKYLFYGQKVEYEFIFIGPKESLTSVLFLNEQIPTRFISAGKVRRYFSLRNVGDFLKIPIGIVQALWHLWVLMPDAVFSKGGYGSFPVVLAAWLYRIPILIHESDAVPGFTNRILARFAKKVVVSFAETSEIPLKKMLVLGNPIRRGLLTGDTQQAVQPFSLDPQRKTIFVMGGSQGAQRVNDFVLSVLPRLLIDFQVIHQCGEKNFSEVKKGAHAILKKEVQPFYHLFPFFNCHALCPFHPS